MDDHYFGAIREKIAAFMKDVNEELWKLGVSAKTQHNEVAPAQHELAPIYAQANIAVDHNQLVMETLKKVAGRHGLQCLLHEKPFAGVNGSGKHNNWSITTDDGINLLEPGKTPHENVQFLLVLTCILKAVDKHADLLRESAADVGNDHRLGANEAPPAIVSVYLGEQLQDVLSQLISTGEATHSLAGQKLETGVKTLPDFMKDATDRNRTSPFAFTGNKFEFRMVGSQDSIAQPNVVLNTIVAEAFAEACDVLEKAPFDIPESWIWVRLSQIWSILNGDRGKNYPAKSTLSKTGIPFISAINLNGKTVVEDENLLCLSQIQYDKLVNGKLQKNDVVVCIRGHWESMVYTHLTKAPSHRHW